MSKIKTYPHSVLRQKCTDALACSEEKRLAVLEEMKTLILDFKALGLAANQIGENIRLIGVMAPGEKEPSFLMNPEIVDRGGVDIGPESCLSLPGVRVNIKRNLALTVKYIDPTTNKEKEHDVYGQTARIIQHEMDHLDGITLVQSCPRAMRYKVLNDLKKGVRQIKKNMKAQNFMNKLKEEVEKFDKAAEEKI